jgi:putative lipoprotein (rSAM/lipoprotein system)
LNNSGDQKFYCRNELKSKYIKTMKRNILKKYNYLIAFLISLIGVGSAFSLSGCEYGTPLEYGTPTATFKVSGTVSAEDNTKISNIRVVMESDTTFTDILGAYNVQVATYPDDQDLLVKFDDIDGISNGLYQSEDTIASFDNPKFIRGDGSWYKGEVSKEINIKLKAGK